LSVTSPEDSWCSRHCAAPTTADRGGGRDPRPAVGQPCHWRPCPYSPAANRVHPLLCGFLSPALSSSGDLGGTVVTDKGPTPDSAVRSRSAGGLWEGWRSLPLPGAVVTLSLHVLFVLLSLLVFPTFQLLFLLVLQTPQNYCSLPMLTAQSGKGPSGKGPFASL